MTTRRATASAAVAFAALLLGSAPVLAQDPSASPGLDTARLEALCEDNTPDEAALANCLDVVHRYLLPDSSPAPVASTEPISDVPGLGDTLGDDNLAVTLLGIEWVTPATPSEGPEPERRWLSVLVRYEALDDADLSPTDDWRIEDQSGAGGRYVRNAKQPALVGGKLTKGEVAEGWLTFQLPLTLTGIALSYRDGIFGEDHGWVVTYDASMGPNVVATPRPTSKPTPVPGLGFTYVAPNLRVTLQRVEWDTRGTFRKPEVGKQWVSVLVRYVARKPADYDAIYDWGITDDEGFRGDHVLFTPKEPELTDGRLRKGHDIAGWVTFEFPKGVRAITVTYKDGMFGEEHVWVVKRR